jgi:hypothetical protein
MSKTTSVAWVTNTVIAPPDPAGTIAAFATTVPVGSFNVDTFGIDCPVGHVVRFPSGPGGTTVKFSE